MDSKNTKTKLISNSNPKQTLNLNLSQKSNPKTIKTIYYSLLNNLISNKSNSKFTVDPISNLFHLNPSINLKSKKDIKSITLKYSNISN